MAETKSVAGTQTEKNLATSYLNESQSYARYTFYAQKAVKESFFPIGYAFNETAANELRHAKIFLNFLPGGKLVAEVPTDSVAIGSTEDNLKIASTKKDTKALRLIKPMPMWPTRKASLSSPLTSEQSLRSNSTIWIVSRHILTSCRKAPFGREKNRFFGSAWFAVTSMKVQNLLLSVLPAIIRISITSAWTFISSKRERLNLQSS